MTPQEIYALLVETAKRLGFEDFEVNDDNLAKIGLTSPETINNFISLLNLILNNKIYANIGSFSKLAKYFKTTSPNNGVGRRTIKFSSVTESEFDDNINNQFTYYQNNTLEALVTKDAPEHQKTHQTNHIFTINNRYSSYIKVNYREMAKAFTVATLTAYIEELTTLIVENFDTWLTYKILRLYTNDRTKFCNVTGEVFPNALGYISRLKNGVYTSTNFAVPENVDSNIRANEGDLFVITSGEHYQRYFEVFHINPNIKVFDTRNNEDESGVYGIIGNKRSINVEIYNTNVEEFDVPNSFDKTIFFNCDLSLNIDTSYPSVVYVDGE